MDSLFIICLTGLFAGSLHIISGPDHLAAVLPLSIGRKIRAFGVGATWGLGHGLGVLVLGAIGQFGRGYIQIERISHWSELIVGFFLILLGLWTLQRSRIIVLHHHPHEHQETDDHAHAHVHLNDKTVGSPTHPSRGDHKLHDHSAFGLGILHGLAGAGHLFGVIPSLALKGTAAWVYLWTYLIGSILAMGLFATGIGLFVRDERHLPLALRLSGTAAILIGFFWIGKTLLA